jgi:hypothetical protein
VTKSTREIFREFEAEQRAKGVTFGQKSLESSINIKGEKKVSQ